jgi:hypothetical protein
VFVRGAAVLAWLLGSKFTSSSQNHSARKIAVEYLQKWGGDFAALHLFSLCVAKVP